MLTDIKYRTKLHDYDSRMDRAVWIEENIPTKEYHIYGTIEKNEDNNIVEIETCVTIWCENADKIATEFWFKFP